MMDDILLPPEQVLNKACRVCGVEKLESEFRGFGKSYKTVAVCKKCEGKRNHEYNMAHREQTRVANKRYKLANPDYQKKWKETPVGKFKTYVTWARNRKIGWDLTQEQFQETIYNTCHYCGTSRPTGVGIDRVDSSVGYTFENCVSCCTQCNKMKLDYPLDVFVEQIKAIHRNLGL